MSKQNCDGCSYKVEAVTLKQTSGIVHGPEMLCSVCWHMLRGQPGDALNNSARNLANATNLILDAIKELKR